MSNIMSNIIGWTFELLDENSYYPLLMPICDVEKYKDNLKKNAARRFWKRFFA